MEPVVEMLDLPAEYRTGPQAKTLTWPAVLARLAEARTYWLASVRPDGRPHVVPVDGMWLDGVFYFGGSPQTVHVRNLRNDGRVAVHLEDATSAVIAEGRAEVIVPSDEEAARLAAESKKKYGYGVGAEVYRAGCWALRPKKVIAWNSIAEDGTRFLFDT